MFSFWGEKEGEWRKDEGMTGLEKRVSKREWRGLQLKQGRVWVMEEWQRERGKEGWKVQSGWNTGGFPLRLVSQSSLTDTWTSADRVVTTSLAQEVSLGGMTLDLLKSSLCRLKHLFTSFPAFISLKVFHLQPYLQFGRAVAGALQIY